MLSQFFAIDPASEFLVNGSYNYGLVALSVIIAIFSSFFALQLRSFADSNRNTASYKYALVSSSAAFSGGVWSMHFIGMLAFSLCVEVDYNLTMTALSFLPVFGATIVAFHLIRGFKVDTKTQFISALLLGAGIGLMHYSGMEAMRLGPKLAYDPLWFALSILVAVSLAWIALGIHMKLRKPNATTAQGVWACFIGAIVMGLAVSGMHYTGMHAARFISQTPYYTEQANLDHVVDLALAIAIVSVLLVSVIGLLHSLLRFRILLKKQKISQSRLEAVLNTAVDGIVTITDKGKVLSFNAGAERILGYSSDEVVGNNVKMLMPDDIAVQHDYFLSRYKDTRQRNIIGYGREVTAQHKDGHTLPIHLGVGEVALPDKKVMFVGFITDLSEHKKMQQQLAAQEHHYRTLINNMPGVAFRCRLDKYWSMVYISPIVESLTGYTDEEFVSGSIHFSDLIDPEFEESLREKIYNAIAINQSDYSFEYRIKTKSGMQKWILDKGTFEPDDENEMCIAGVLVDISERKSMEHELVAAKDKAEAAAETKQAFLANMSHEIRTPMNSIIGFSEVLLDSPLSKNQRHQLTNVLQSARSLLHLLNDILDSAKLEQGKVSIERIPFDLLVLCDSVVSSFYHQAQKKGLTLDMQLDDSLLTYYVGDPQRIRQVLVNLLGNALKFTEQGRVTLKVIVAGNDVRFVIEDTGIGIAPERVNAIFMPFEQADDSTTRRFGGTGLGTTICRQLVNLMGGDIDVQSTLGVGSEFSFNLPLLPASDEQISELQQEHASSKSLPTMPTLNILIADDVAQNRELLELRLGNLGHKTQTAVNGEEAVIKATSEHFDVVLMDIHMPICDGLEATRQLRQHESATNIQPTVVIALTASVLQSDREAARKAGMNSFATKPVVVEDLMCDIARLLNIQVDVANESVVQHNTHTGNISVNEEKGINLWGTLELYIHQLQQFFVSKTADIKALGKFNELDEEQLMLVHTLKGLAGNLCLPNLSAQLNDIERQGMVTDEHRFALFSCLDEIDGYLQHHPLTNITSAQTSVENVSVLKQLLPHIQELCDNFEYDSNSCEQLQEAAGQQFMGDVEQIIELINEFEFDKAKQHIATLMSQLESFEDD